MTKSDSRSLNFPNLSYIKTDSSPLYVFVFPTTEERICICLYPNVYFVFWLEIKFFWQVLWGRVQLGRDKSQCHTPGTTSSPLLPIILLRVSLYLLKRYSHVWNKVLKNMLCLLEKNYSKKIFCWYATIPLYCDIEFGLKPKPTPLKYSFEEWYLKIRFQNVKQKLCYFCHEPIPKKLRKMARKMNLTYLPQTSQVGNILTTVEKNCIGSYCLLGEVLALLLVVIFILTSLPGKYWF